MALHKGGAAIVTRRARLEAAVEQAIDLLNRMDGDADLEPDDHDLGAGEDEGAATFGLHLDHRGPGCVLFDWI